MVTDATPDHPYSGITGSSITFQTAGISEADAFVALSDGATRTGMALQPTFRAERYASLVDRFGVPWMVNCPEPYPEG